MKEAIRPAVALSLILLLACVLPLTARGQNTNPQLEEAQRLEQQATQARQAPGRRAEAIGLQERALTIREKALGPEHPDVATTLNGLALLYQDTGDYARAEPLFQRALTVREKVLGPEHLLVANVLGNLANLYQAQRDYARAEPLYQRALTIREKALGPEHPRIVFVLGSLADLYQQTHNYAAAEMLLKRRLAIQEKADGPEHPAVARTLDMLARLYRNTGNHAAAEPLLKRALAIAEKRPEEALFVFRGLNRLAGLYQATGNNAAALPLLQRALALQEQIYGAKPDYLIRYLTPALANLVEVSQAAGNDAAAEQFVQRIVAIYEKIYGPEPVKVAEKLEELSGRAFRGSFRSFGPLSSLLSLYGDPSPGSLADDDQFEQFFAPTATGELLLKRALDICEKAYGPENPHVAQRLISLASSYVLRQNKAAAEPLLQRALAIYDKTLGAESPDTAEGLKTLASIYLLNGNTAQARILLHRVLAIYDKTLRAESPDTAEKLKTLALLAFSLYLNDPAEARILLRRLLAIQEKAYGPEHPEVSATLNYLALIYQSTGDYGPAEPLLKRALAIQEKAYGPEHLNVAPYLTPLAQIYASTGDYAQAESLYKRILAIYEKAYGPEHLYVAGTLVQLAFSSVSQGDYAATESLYKRALAIYEKISPESQFVAVSLLSLAGTYQAMGNYAAAAPLYKRALAIQEKIYGPEHLNVATYLMALASCYQAKGDNAQAAPLLQRAVVISEKAHGPEDRLGATLLIPLASSLAGSGNYAAAMPLYKRILAFYEKTIPESPVVPALLWGLSGLHRATGATQQALALALRAASLDEKNLTLFLAAGSERRKQLYLNTLAQRASFAVSLHTRVLPDNPQAAELALTTILQRKGRALDAFTDQIGALRRRAAPQDVALLDQLAHAQSQLANLQLAENKQLTLALRPAEVKRLTAEIERLQDDISRRSAEFRTLTQPVTVSRVQEAIPADAALVELFVYQPPDKANGLQPRPPHYVAYVLQHTGGIAFADLGLAAEIDADAAKFHAALQSPKTPAAEVKQLARALDERVMRPVRKLLGDTKRVFLSPDGALNLVPFAALVDENGRYLVENYSFNYLTSGRDLLRLQVPGESQDAPTVLANPLFDLKRQSIAATARRELGLWGGADNKVEFRSFDFTAVTYTPLPGTAGEAQALGALWPQARVWTEAAATEAALKAVNRPRLLHIATHGFFFPDQAAEKPDGRGFGLLADNAAPRVPLRENPMLRSGLILAGVNQRQSGPDNDGVLTAQETAGLNLFGTKLVVLSACETGLGEVQNGAGVYGLRRALVLAGSETQVMSLWKVADTATRDLMTAYYTRLQRGEGRSEAMRQVQLEMLRSGKLAPLAGESRKIEQEAGKGKTGATDWRHPYYWASFIQSGAWTSLDGK